MNVLNKDINNLFQIHRFAKLKGRSPLQILYKDYFISNDFYNYFDIKNERKYVTFLIIIFCIDFIILKSFFYVVFFFDSRYKTKIYNMFLFNCYDILYDNKTFNWIIVFWNNENENIILSSYYHLILYLQNIEFQFQNVSLLIVLENLLFSKHLILVFDELYFIYYINDILI